MHLRDPRPAKSWAKWNEIFKCVITPGNVYKKYWTVEYSRRTVRCLISWWRVVSSQWRDLSNKVCTAPSQAFSLNAFGDESEGRESPRHSGSTHALAFILNKAIWRSFVRLPRTFKIFAPTTWPEKHRSRGVSPKGWTIRNNRKGGEGWKFFCGWIFFCLVLKGLGKSRGRNDAKRESFFYYISRNITLHGVEKTFHTCYPASLVYVVNWQIHGFIW